ncbi:MAG: hypothetical protein ACYSTG_11280, partial [Planctomycetota bacterium]
MSARYRVHLLHRRIANKKYQPNPQKRHRLTVCPRIRERQELEDVLDWLGWYLPEESGLTVTVFVSRSLAGDIDGWKLASRANVRLVSGRSDRESFETVLVYKNTLWNSVRALMAFNAKLDSIDKYFFGIHESLAFERIYESHDTEELSRLRNELEQISDANYRTLYDRYKGCRRAFVLGTGPSLQSA